MYHQLDGAIAEADVHWAESKGKPTTTNDQRSAASKPAADPSDVESEVRSVHIKAHLLYSVTMLRLLVV